MLHALKGQASWPDPCAPLLEMSPRSVTERTVSRPRSPPPATSQADVETQTAQLSRLEAKFDQLLALVASGGVAMPFQLAPAPAPTHIFNGGAMGGAGRCIASVPQMVVRHRYTYCIISYNVQGVLNDNI